MIFFDLDYPTHFHLFKNVINDLNVNWHQI